jgi:hypothetical protein
MKARLIKPDTALPIENDEQPLNEVQIVNTIRSWVNEFKMSKASKARLDFRRINHPEKQ